MTLKVGIFGVQGERGQDLGKFFELKYYGDTQPHAIVFWYKNDERIHHTWCFDEGEVEAALDRHKTAGDFYSTLVPSVNYL